MKFCTHCGKEIMEDAVICTNCGCPVGNPPKGNEDDTPSLGYNILSFCIPFVGLILFCVMLNKTPHKAKSLGLWALIGWIVGMVFMAIAFSV